MPGWRRRWSSTMWCMRRRRRFRFTRWRLAQWTGCLDQAAILDLGTNQTSTGVLRTGCRSVPLLLRKRKDGTPMNTLDFLDKKSLRDDIPEFRPGDTLNVHVKVIEGSKERVQVFKGVVIRRQGGASARPSPSARSPSVSASSAPSRSTARTWHRSRSSPAVTSVAPSCTTSAICVARPPRSRKSADLSDEPGTAYSQCGLI